ncbi:amidohydrolase [uncultured Brachyspira sp.]|uniref:amidohydrolase n=1 Tax=uncultured Brachyspira sp. TaxID=221953 RepID=UPI0025F15966|nr:amidohydrolase [uncultured Brachyspira sp.]
MRIFKNAKIYSMDKDDNIYEALAVENGRIAFAGSNEEVLKQYSDCKDIEDIIDLEGRTVVPGFNDSCVRFVEYARFNTMLNLSKCKSIKEIIDLAKDSKKHGGWVIGWGWNQDYFEEKRMLTKNDLDSISNEYPIAFRRCCGEMIAANSKALEICGIDEKMKSDSIDFENGLISSKDMILILSKLKSLEIDTLKSIILDTQEAFFKMGITSVQTDDLRSLPDFDYRKIIDAYQKLNREKKLKIRVCEQAQFIDKKDIDDFRQYYYYQYINDERFKVSRIKLIIDGAIGSRTALLKDDYNDAKGFRGISQYKQEDLDELVAYANSLDYSLAIQATGDGAIDMALNAIEKIKDTKDFKYRRNGLMYCQITDKKLFEKMKELNVGIYYQPIFLHYDMHIVEDRVGEQKASTSYAYKTAKDIGINIGFGSSGPIDGISVMEGIHCAVNREDLNGWPKSGWMPQEKLTVKEAVYLYTMGSAYMSSEDDIKGSIEEDKLADFVVLDKDIFETDTNEIKNIKVLKTIIDGDIVYSA